MTRPPARALAIGGVGDPGRALRRDQRSAGAIRPLPVAAVPSEAFGGVAPRLMRKPFHKLGGDDHELIARAGRPRDQRNGTVPRGSRRVGDHRGAACYGDRPARRRIPVKVIDLERDDRVVDAASDGAIGSRPNNDLPPARAKFIGRTAGRAFIVKISRRRLPSKADRLAGMAIRRLGEMLRP
jgi:hypothetical protein